MYDLKEEIRARLPVEDVVGQYVELKRAGRNLKGRSPWGVDRTPSFMVAPEKGIWHDFSANKGGDIFTFIMEVEGISFREALEKLAAMAGVDISKYHGGDPAISKKKLRAKEALKLAAKYYQACLVRNKTAFEYAFYKRNLNRGTVKDFLIGYAPDGNVLKKVLLKRGFTEAELDTAGLLNRFKTDLFRDRLMVPFIDRNGDVIGFTARVLKNSEPKYLNTPETLLFNKSRFIFGFFNAKEAIRQNNFAVIVEGNMDVISSHQAGVKEAVATSGTAMTEQHLKILAGLTSDIRLAYDGDAAGIKATERAIILANKLGIRLSVISDYHGAKDPDELIQKDQKLWQEAVAKPMPATDWLLSKYEENLDLRLAPDKKQYSDVALRLLGFLKDEVERASYEEKVAKKLDVPIAVLREKGSRLNAELEKSARRRFLKKPKTAAKKPEIIRKLENSLLALKLFGGITQTKIPLDLPEDETRLSELELIFNAEHTLPDGTEVTSADLEKEAASLLKRYQAELKKQKIADLNLELKSLNDNDEKAEKILQEIVELQKE